MAALPSVRNGSSQILYPFLRRVRFQTDIAVMANGTEQRSAGRGVPLFEGTLTYNLLPKTERDLLNAFFSARGGDYDSTWQLTALGQTYQSLKFTDSVISWVEQTAGLYSTSLNFRQVNNAGYSIPTPGASFPTLSAGVMTQYPFAPEWRQLTSVNDQASGWAYASKWYGSPLTGFPAGAMRRWGLKHPVLPNADAVTIENFFVGCLGAYNQFSLTDPEDGTVHSSVRFESDALEISYIDYNHTEINFSLIETFG